MGASSMAPYLSEAVKRSSQLTAFSESYRFSWEKCEERGFLFRCIPSKYQEGKQGYQCEGLNIYLGRHAIFVKKYWNVDTNITQSYITVPIQDFVPSCSHHFLTYHKFDFF